MKAAPFQYLRPASVRQACEMLAADDGARLISGGQTLVPMMAMRLSRPTTLIDIARLPDLAGISDDGDTVTIGAVTRQLDIEQSPVVADKVPLLAAALPFVGHLATRSRGTIGGSIANADPAAEIPLVAAVLDAGICVAGPDGEEWYEAADFFIGPMLTALPEQGCITLVRFPVWSSGRVGVSFQEISARKSDFAIVSAAAQTAFDDSGRCTAAALGVGGVADRPEVLDIGGLVGTTPGDAELEDAAVNAVAGLEPEGDLHASADYRRRVAGALASRALKEAARSAREDGDSRS